MFHLAKSVKRRCVLICQNRSCARSGSAEVLAAFRANPVDGVFVAESDCMGQCSSGPTVQVNPDGTWYCRVRPADVPTIVEQHFKGDRPVEALLHPRLHPRYETYSGDNS